MARLNPVPRARRRGFSVVEMIVALTITLVAMTIASQLILESQRRLAHSGRRNLDMSADIALERLRIDVRAATTFDAPSVPGVFSDGSKEPLVLEGHYSGATIAYELFGTDLRRVVYEGIDFNPASQRNVLQNVTDFKWRNHPDVSGLLEVLVTHESTPLMTSLSAAGQRESLEPAVRTYSMMVFPRDVWPFLGKSRW